MSESLVMRNAFDKAQALEMVKKLPLHRPVELIIREASKKRTLTANAQQHVWYKKISEFTHCDIRTAGNSCKLDFGLPILLADAEAGRRINFVLKGFNFFSMTREQQINVMDLFAITSLFSTKQHNEYRDNIQMYYFEQGLSLEYQE